MHLLEGWHPLQEGPEVSREKTGMPFSIKRKKRGPFWTFKETLKTIIQSELTKNSAKNAFGPEMLASRSRAYLA
jgi:hypothetical protein